MAASTAWGEPGASWTEGCEGLISQIRAFAEELAVGREGLTPSDRAHGHDVEVWARMAGELGLQGIAIPETYGGGGRGVIQQLVVMSELGRALLCTPYLSTAILAAGAVLDSEDDDVCRDLLPRIAAGGLTATVVLPGAADGPGAGVLTAEARRTAAGHRLTGAGVALLDGRVADVFLVAAECEGRATLFAVDGESVSIAPGPGEPAETTPGGTAVEFHDAPARPVGRPGAAEQILARALRRAALATAAEQAGGARRCLEMSVRYARERRQFGQPIGAFQAISHKCADMRLTVEAAWSALDYAARAEAAGAEDADWAASAAKSLCSEAYVRVATDAVQIHGGAGYGWDSEAQAHLRRALATERLFGDPSEHRRFCADLLVGSAL